MCFFILKKLPGTIKNPCINFNAGVLFKKIFFRNMKCKNFNPLNKEVEKDKSKSSRLRAKKDPHLLPEYNKKNSLLL